MHGMTSSSGTTSDVGGKKRPPFDIHHMTTAASIWLTSALGIAAGLGMWRLLVASTIAAVVILTLGLPIDRYLFGRFSEGKDGDPIE